MGGEGGSLSLAGRCAVVTGAGRGFGAQIASDLAVLGATVGVVDLDEDAAEAVAAEIVRDGRHAVAATCDVSDFEAVHAAIAEVTESLGAIDVLVNNAGIVSSTPLLDTTEDEWDRVVAVDYTSLFNCSRAVVPAMVERRWGRIVNVSSVAGKRGGGFLGKGAYCVAKAGVIGFTKALARELAPSGVTVNAVAPGAMDTEMTRVLSQDPDLLMKVEASIPMGYRGTIDDVADTVAFLVSDLASYMTGETINVDGGVTME